MYKGTQGLWKMYLWWSLCTFYYLHARPVRVTEGDLGLCSCGIFQVIIKQNKQTNLNRERNGWFKVDMISEIIRSFKSMLIHAVWWFMQYSDSCSMQYASGYLSSRAASFQGQRGLHSVDWAGTPIIHFGVGDGDALDLVAGAADQILFAQRYGDNLKIPAQLQERFHIFVCSVWVCHCLLHHIVQLHLPVTRKERST